MGWPAGPPTACLRDRPPAVGEDDNTTCRTYDGEWKDGAVWGARAAGWVGGAGAGRCRLQSTC